MDVDVGLDGRIRSPFLNFIEILYLFENNGGVSRVSQVKSRIKGSEVRAPIMYYWYNSHCRWSLEH